MLYIIKKLFDRIHEKNPNSAPKFSIEEFKDCYCAYLFLREKDVTTTTSFLGRGVTMNDAFNNLLSALKENIEIEI